MARSTDTKCPNCGLILELSEKSDRALCVNCGMRVMLVKEDVVLPEPKVTCPNCNGKGTWKCEGEYETIPEPYKLGKIQVISCRGFGKCTAISTTKGNYSCDNGKCNFCDGFGSTLIAMCEMCNGTGLCKICKGTGKCKYCRGTGDIKCEACSGTGFKVYEGERYKK